MQALCVLISDFDFVFVGIKLCSSLSAGFFVFVLFFESDLTLVCFAWHAFFVVHTPTRTHMSRLETLVGTQAADLLAFMMDMEEVRHQPM